MANNDSKRQQRIDVGFRNYLYHSAVQGRPLQGKELDLAVRANNAIKTTKGQLPHGGGNQRLDILATNGRTTTLTNMAREKRDRMATSTTGRNIHPNENIRHTLHSATSAELLRGGNCDEHANLTALNMVSQKQEPTISAQTYTLAPFDHIYTRAQTTEEQINWVQNTTTKKWEKQGMKDVTHTMTADSWVVNPHATRASDYVMKDKPGRNVVNLSVTGDDLLSQTKQIMGITPQYEQRKHTASDTLSNPTGTGVKILKNPASQPFLFDVRQPLHDSFSTGLQEKLEKRNAMLAQVRQVAGNKRQDLDTRYSKPDVTSQRQNMLGQVRKTAVQKSSTLNTMFSTPQSNGQHSELMRAIRNNATKNK